MVNRDSYRRKDKKALLSRLSEAVANETASAMDVSIKQKVEESPPVVSEPSVSQVSSNTSSRRMLLGFLPGMIPAFVVMVALAWVLIVSRTQASDTHLDYSYIGPLPSSEEKLLNNDEFIPSPVSRCSPVSNSEEPDINAQAYLAVFEDSFEVAYEKNSTREYPFASIVKLLGSLVVVRNYDMDEMLGLIEPVDAEGNGMDLEVGEEVTVRDLLAATLIGSRNDAMYVLAQNYDGGSTAFISEMRTVAGELGMKDTLIENVIGLDGNDQHSTPVDVAILLVAAMRDPIISDLLSRAGYTVRTSLGREVPVWTTNSLLGKVDGVIGGKTGYTEKAGLSLVIYVDDDPDFVTVVFNADDRYGESEKLIQAVRDGYACY